jgi:hypothetical protein
MVSEYVTTIHLVAWGARQVTRLAPYIEFLIGDCYGGQIALPGNWIVLSVPPQESTVAI